VSANFNRISFARLKYEFCKLNVDLCTVNVRVLGKLRSSEKNEEILHYVVAVTMCAKKKHLLFKFSNQSMQLIFH
jgi:hypothetical protein